MNDPGLQDAIHAAASATEIACQAGAPRPSDLCGNPSTIEETDAARAAEYALLAVLLSRAPDSPLLERLGELRGDETPLGMAHAALAEAAANTNADKVEREYFDLFIGLGRGELLPYASYYLTGFLNERPLARLREDLCTLGIERSGVQSEPEDHAAVLCEIMAGMIGGELPVAAESQRRIFAKHLAPWMGRFFADLEVAEAADFYRPVGRIGRLLVEIEAEAFTLPA